MGGGKKDLFDDDESSSSSSSDCSSTSSSSASTNPTGINSRKEERKSTNETNGGELRLTVNKKFATKYQNKKEQEELQQIRHRRQRDGINDSGGSSVSDSSDEEEDEDGALFTPTINIQFLKTIKALRKRDASIYDPTAKFFDDHVERDDDKETKVRKPQRYKDVVREHILEQIEDEDNGNAEKLYSENFDDSKILDPRSKLGYNKEQDELRKAFLTESLKADRGENEDDWMVVKKKAALPEQEELEKEASETLKEIESLTKKNKKDNTFKDPRGEVGDGEQYLLDFITKKKWIDRNDSILTGGDNEESSLEDLERADEYESNYNFRFEEAAQETATSGAAFSVQTFARSQTMNTVRRPDTSRKDKREARKERKAKERKAKEDQLKRLKNAKKKEIDNKLSQVKAVIGDLEESRVDEAAILKMLEGDYDPEMLEKAMEEAYGEEFYEQEDGEWKTDLDVRRTLEGDYEGDELVGQDDVNGGMYDNVQEGEFNEDGIKGEYDENEEWNDDIFDNSCKESKLEKKIKKKMQEELYKLDYEDIVAGIPTRFKYREVESNDYGLTTQEILYARDTTLKQFVSLKKMAPYNEQSEYNVGSKKRRKFREMLKKDLEDSLPVEEEILENDAESTAADSMPKKKRRRLKKGKKKSKVDFKDSSIESEPKNDVEVSDDKVDLNEKGERSNETKTRRKKSGKKKESLNLKSTSKVRENNKSQEFDLEKTKSEKVDCIPVESKKSMVESKIRRAKSTDDKRKNKKTKGKKSSITGISHSRLASYGL